MHKRRSLTSLLLRDNLFHILRPLVLPLPRHHLCRLGLSIVYVIFGRMVLTLKVTLVACELGDC